MLYVKVFKKKPSSLKQFGTYYTVGTRAILQSVVPI